MGRLTAVVVLAAAFSAGCGGSGSHSSRTLDGFLKRPGPDVSITAGASEFVRGSIRYPFLVIRNDARPVERSTASVWVAGGRDRAPFTRVTAQLEPIGIAGRSARAFGEVSRIYVAHFRVPRAGRYWLVAEPAGAKIQAIGSLEVTARSPSPAVGAQAPRSATPTLADASVARLTTRRPPDLALLRYSVAGTLSAHRPFVVTFATPKFCTSRICGPVVDVVDAVRESFASSPVRFIHVEVFRDNDPAKGYNRWMRRWHLRSEPWTFLVGREGRVKAKFEGSVSAAELTAAIRKRLL
ncbi:MAG TPA: hypothetical protein VK287_09115 [Gaiellaceae bacterium]|nr:hypothetical protein [Gaiellaceae bacterium]